MISQTLKDLSAKVLKALGNAPASLLDNYPEVAVLTSRDGRVLANNQTGEALAHLIAERNPEALQDLIQQVAAHKGASLAGFRLDEETQLDITAVLVPEGDAVLLLGHDQTFERNMLSALVESRGRYKDLVDVSSDFAWEIGPDGTFVFVSPGGALDYSSDEFIGQSPEDFELNPVNLRDASPFVESQPTTDIDVQMRRRDGELAQLKVSALPLFDRLGEWRGSRGVCRDFTQDSLRQTALNEARIREKLLKHLVGIIRDEVDPLKTLTGSIKYIVRASSFAGCKIFMRDEYGEHDQNFIMVAEYGDKSCMPPDDDILPEIAGKVGAKQIAGKGWSGLLAMTGYRHLINGAICVWGSEPSSIWPVDEIALVDTVSDQLGIAIERVMHHERILRLSRTDELTGLLNRRAFLDEELPRRMERLQFSGGTAALLFVDLDNFKLVNDVHGHNRGDEVLIKLARFLEEHSRPGDAIARFGGDEFAMWLDGMDAESAKKRAQRMTVDSLIFKQYSGNDQHPLGLSIGVSMYQSDNVEPLDQLMSRADEAMYQVKRGGKGGFAFALASDAKVADSPAAKMAKFDPQI